MAAPLYFYNGWTIDPEYPDIWIPTHDIDEDGFLGSLSVSQLYSGLARRNLIVGRFSRRVTVYTKSLSNTTLPDSSCGHVGYIYLADPCPYLSLSHSVGLSTYRPGDNNNNNRVRSPLDKLEPFEGMLVKLSCSLVHCPYRTFRNMGFLSVLVSHVAIVVAFAPLIYLIFCLVYNYFLHPLRDYPGPLFWRISPFPRAWAQCRGTLVFDVARFQRRYGPVLRIGPSELAFVSDEAWKNIYGHRGVGEEENPKDLRFYRLSNHIPHSILSAGRAEHGLLRRQLASGFSERSLRGQEDIIGGYVDLLVRRLRENSDNGKTALNMREWYNWTTFDIIGNLGFGSDFQCLEKTTYSPWIRVITDSIKQGAWLQAIAYTGLEGVARWIISLAMASFQGHQTLSRNKVEQRIQLGKQGERLDFLDGLIKQVRVSFTKADQSTSMTADEDR